MMAWMNREALQCTDKELTEEVFDGTMLHEPTHQRSAGDDGLADRVLKRSCQAGCDVIPKSAGWCC